jgi:hypothetical protein
MELQDQPLDFTHSNIFGRNLKQNQQTMMRWQDLINFTWDQIGTLLEGGFKVPLLAKKIIKHDTHTNLAFTMTKLGSQKIKLKPK